MVVVVAVMIFMVVTTLTNSFACRNTRAGGGQPEDMAWSTEASVFVCDVPQSVEAAVAAVKVSGDCQATHACPVFSPCGRYVA